MCSSRYKQIHTSTFLLRIIFPVCGLLTHFLKSFDKRKSLFLFRHFDEVQLSNFLMVADFCILSKKFDLAQVHKNTLFFS